MNKQLIAIISILSLLSFAMSEQCFVPLGQWGHMCKATSTFAGVKGSYVNYHISVLEPGSQVFCYGLGVSEYVQGGKCSWGMQNLGLVNNQYVSVVWDNANAKPMIQCYATGRTSVLQWTYTTGNGNLSCTKRDSKKNKISTDPLVELMSE